MRRRTVLAVLGTSTLAGCGLRSSDDGPPVGLGRGRLLNGTERDALALHVTVDRDGTRVYDEPVRVEVAETLAEPWMGEQVPYTVTVSVTDESRDAETSWEQLDSLVSDWGDMDCYEIAFDVEPDAIDELLNSDGVPCP
jgi:hypothetical protein